MIEHKMLCSCSRIRIGTIRTEHRNWNPDCPEHGVKSDWYNSEEQQAVRKARSDRTRELQLRAAKARRDARA